MDWIRIKNTRIRMSDIVSVETDYDLMLERYFLVVGVRGIGNRTFEYRTEEERDKELRIIGASLWT